MIRDLTNQKNLKIQALNIDPNHIHLLIAVPSKDAVSDIISELKSVYAIFLRREFMKEIHKCLWKDGLLGAKGYYCNTVGDLNIEEVERYIKAHQKYFNG